MQYLYVAWKQTEWKCVSVSSSNSDVISGARAHRSKTLSVLVGAPNNWSFFFRLLEAAVCRFFENCTSSYPRLIENALDIFVHIFTGLLNWFSFSLLLSFFGHINSAFTLASLFYMKTCIFMLPYFNGIVVGSSPSSQISGNVLDKAILQF